METLDTFKNTLSPIKIPKAFELTLHFTITIRNHFKRIIQSKFNVSGSSPISEWTNQYLRQNSHDKDKTTSNCLLYHIVLLSKRLFQTAQRLRLLFPSITIHSIPNVS